MHAIERLNIKYFHSGFVVFSVSAVQHERIPRRQRFEHASINISIQDNIKANSTAINMDPKLKPENINQGTTNPNKCMKITPNFSPNSSILPPKENRPPKQPAKKTGYSIESLLDVAKKEKTKLNVQSAEVSGCILPTSPPASPSMLQNFHERIYESLQRILQTGLFWPNSVPTFSELPNSDKAKLLDEGWAELFVLGLIESNFPLSVLSSYLRNSIYLFHTKDVQQKIERFELVLQKLKSLVIDPNELAFLKAIAVFKPCK